MPALPRWRFRVLLLPGQHEDLRGKRANPVPVFRSGLQAGPLWVLRAGTEGDRPISVEFKVNAADEFGRAEELMPERTLWVLLQRLQHRSPYQGLALLLRELR